MTIRPGSRVGVYEVGALLGEGGMGAVYRARDSRLERDVAIKVIRPDLASDPDRAVRFDREARLLASLNHPHIATVHGLEQAGDARVLVLELVSGDTLAERLREGPLPAREALGFALQIASGIEAAHAHGIVHRDLKPANIKITQSGAVKILDFGLAKALSIDSAADPRTSSPTLTAAGTAEGVVLGTAAYMSPEQARGKEVDRRTDVWAFGCVMYEMLAGRTPFSAATLSDTLAAILTREPDWSRLPADTPPATLRLLRRCLHKDTSHRLRDIGDAILDIEEALTWKPGESQAAAGTPLSGIFHTRRGIAVSLVAALLLGAAIAGTAFWTLRPSQTDAPRPPAQFSVTLPDDERIGELDFPAIAISPTDAHIVYVASKGGRSQLFARTMESLDTRPLPGTEGALCPFFSPDGQWIAFFAAGSLKKVPVAGGAVRTIAKAPIGFGGTWAPDNSIVFAPSNASELWRVSADGGEPQAITALDVARGEFSHRWPEILPDGKSVLFVVGTEGSWDDAVIAVQTIGANDRRDVVQGGTSPRFSARGSLFYTRGGTLYSLPFDGGQAGGGGGPVPNMGQIFESSDGASQFSISRAGSLVYVPASSGQNDRTLVWVDRDGNPQPLAAPPRAFADPRLSPDGRVVAVTIGGTPPDVWTFDIARTRLAQFTFEGGTSPIWSTDGGRIAFAANRGGSPDLFSKAADGSGVEERLTRTPRTDVPAAWAPDGSILFVESDANGRDIALFAPDRSARSVLSTTAHESAPALSPDGRVMAYVSDSSGQPEVYVALLNDPARATRVSSVGGSEPVWRRDGSELYFRSGPHMMAATVRTQPSIGVQTARRLFTGRFETGVAWRPAYDVSQDGTRFLMIRAAEAKEPGQELRVILGWKP